MLLAGEVWEVEQGAGGDGGGVSILPKVVAASRNNFMGVCLDV
jgi:hypothetical protein